MAPLRARRSAMSTELNDHVARINLVDHHAHGTSRGPLGREDLERLLTESDRDVPKGMSTFDSQLGFAIRTHCAPLLGLPAHASAEAYVAARSEKTEASLTELFLGASGVDHLFIDTGHRADALHDVAEMARLSGATVREIVRIESVMEEVAARSDSAAGFADAFQQALAERTKDAVGLKSVVAYRYGLDFDPDEPNADDVAAAVGRWFASRDGSGALEPVSDPVLLRLGLWAGVRRGLPLQLHTGFGDPDLDLARCDPLLLTSWLRAIEPLGTAIMLLHCYPFHRHAGYLAHVFPHVYLDVGLALNFLGVRSSALLSETLELVPFAKILYSSDAWGAPELHHLGAHLWRRSLSGVLGAWVESDDWSTDDAIRVVSLMSRENAARVYGLEL